MGRPLASLQWAQGGSALDMEVAQGTCYSIRRCSNVPAWELSRSRQTAGFGGAWPRLQHFQHFITLHQTSCPPSPNICSANARARHILGSVRKPSVVRARISVSHLSPRALDCRLAPGTGTTAHRGLRPPATLSSESPKCPALTLRCSQGSPQPCSHMLKGSGTSCSLPGGQGASHGARCHCDCPLLCTSRSLTPQGCASPESADPSPVPGQ